MITDAATVDGEQIEITTPELSAEQTAEFNIGILSRREIHRRLEQLDISADAKSLVMKLVDVSVSIGQTILSIGRKILTAILSLSKEYPNTTFGLVAGSVVSALVASIPLIGALISPILTPLFLAFGIASGAMNDMRERGLIARLRQVESQFSVLRSEA
jgi:hypothetical protein